MTDKTIKMYKIVNNVRFIIMTTYNYPLMTVTMTVTGMLASVTVVHHAFGNLTMTMTVGVNEKK